MVQPVRLRWRMAAVAVALMVALVPVFTVLANGHMAKLASLELSDVTLDPGFDPDTTLYKATVPSSVTQTTVSATAVDSSAKVQIQAFAATEGRATRDIPLTAGDDTQITVKVTHESTETTYTITVTHIAKTNAGLADLKLSGVELPPVTVGTGSDTSYGPSDTDGIDVPYDLDSDMAGIQDMTTVMAMPVPGASVGLITPVDADGTMAGHQVKLAAGAVTTVRVTVVAADGNADGTHTVYVERASGMRLKKLELTSLVGEKVTLNPALDMATMKYTASVQAPVHMVTVKPEAEVSADDVVVNSRITADATTDTPTSLSTTVTEASAFLNPGKNTIEVTVGTGTSAEVYTVEITRAAPAAGTLQTLTLSGITLSPPFSSAERSYEATVLSSVKQTTVRAVATVSTEKVGIDETGTLTIVGVATKDVTLAEGPNIITVRVSGSTLEYTVEVERVAKTNAGLADLKLSGVELPPVTVGTGSDTSYGPSDTDGIDVPYDLDSDMAGVQDMTTVMAMPIMGASLGFITPSDADGTMAGHQVKLAAGAVTTIVVTVVAADGETRGAHTVYVERASGMRLKKLELTHGDDEKVTLNPALDMATMKYTASVQAPVHMVTVKPEAEVSADDVVVNSRITADATTDTPTSLSTTVTEASAFLNPGKNTIEVTVGTGTSAEVYTVEITRTVSADASLKKLELLTDDAMVKLSPDFAPDTTKYSASVGDTVVELTVKATRKALDAVVTASPDNNATATVGADGETITVASLAAGDTKVTVTVTAGATVTKYVLTVTKVQSATGLESLTVDGQKATMVKGSATMYMASVDRAVDQVTVKAAVDTSATVSITPVDSNRDVKDHQVDLMVGENKILIDVTSDGLTTSHTLMVTRTPSSDASLKTLEVGGPDNLIVPGKMTYTVDVGHSVESIDLVAEPMDANATVVIDPAGTVSLIEGSTTITVTVTAEDGTTMAYTVVVVRPVVETVTETKTVTKTVPGPTVTRTVTKTVEVPAPAPAQANVIGMTGTATATEVDGRVMITRHDGGASLAIDIGGFIRDADLGQTYQVVRRADGAIVRQWVSPNSPLVYQIPWAVVNTSFTVPVGVIGSIPLDDMAGAEGQLVRRFDGGDDRIFSYAMGQWRHVPDIATFQALGFYWCDVTAADASFFDRISMGAPYPASSTPARMDYPSCSTG